MIYKAMEPGGAAHLFGDWQETIIWSCLQGVMGEVYVDAPVQPKSAMAIFRDFLFFAGIPNAELVLYKPKSCVLDTVIMVGQNAAWHALICQCYGGRAKAVSRYAMKKQADIFDKDKLFEAVNALPKDYEIKVIDETLYYQCKANTWSRDLIFADTDYETWQRLGLGYAVCYGGQIVSGASSYARYRDGIEIEIDTRNDFRRKGLAYSCGAKLILACLENGLYPSWDAQNVWSAALAQKLGYEYDYTYTAYEIYGYGK